MQWRKRILQAMQVASQTMCYANALTISFPNFAYFPKAHKWPQWSSPREVMALTAIPKVPKDSLV